MTVYTTPPDQLLLDTTALPPSILLRAPASSGAAGSHGTAPLSLRDTDSSAQCGLYCAPSYALCDVGLCVMLCGSHALCDVNPMRWESGESPVGGSGYASEDWVSFT